MLRACLLLAAAILWLTGCAVYKNAGADQTPVFSAEELKIKVPVRIGVQVPHITEFESIKDLDMRSLHYELARNEADRLVRILSQCQFAESIVPLDGSADQVDVVVMALPRRIERSAGGNPMILIYGGVLPYYGKSEQGVSFRFLSGGSGDVVFRWTESRVVAIWAPLLNVADRNWTSSAKPSTYWHDLRNEMVRVFSTPEKGPVH